MKKKKEVTKKAAHRPKGSPNKKSAFARDHKFNHFLCTQGFKETVEELKIVGNYKSYSDVFHDAVQLLAARKLPATFYWYNKIQ